MRSLSEWHSTAGHYVNVVARHIGLFGFGIESDISISDVDGITLDI